MANRLIPISFRSLEVNDLGNPAPAVKVPTATKISSTFESSVEKRRYEEAKMANIAFITAIDGKLTIEGDLSDFLFPKNSGGSVTAPLFQLNKFYLFRFLSSHINSDLNEMLYGRFVAQLVKKPDVEREVAAANPLSIEFEFVQFGEVNYEENTPYNATAVADATPTGDFDPQYCTIVPAATKTLAAAETEIGSLTNPVGS